MAGDLTPVLLLGVSGGQSNASGALCPGTVPADAKFTKEAVALDFQLLNYLNRLDCKMSKFVSFHLIPRYHLILAAFFLWAGHKWGQSTQPAVVAAGACAASAVGSGQSSNTSTAMWWGWGWRWWEWRLFSLPDSSEAASAQAVVTGQNSSAATKLGTYALELCWRLRGWLAVCTGKSVHLIPDIRRKKSTVRRQKLQESKCVLGRALVGAVRKETPTVCCTASESGMLGKQTQTSGVLNY